MGIAFAFALRDQATLHPSDVLSATMWDMSSMEINGKIQAVDPEDTIRKVVDKPIDWKTADVSLLKLSLWYLVFQFGIDWIIYFTFSSNLEISRVVHSLLVEMDHVTPALALLKGFYHVPIKGREFSQVFAIYFSLLALLCFYLVALCGIFLSKKFRKLPWLQMVTSKYAVLLVVLAFGLWEVCFFLVGPASLKNYLGVFGTDFIVSICITVPAGQFLILAVLAFYYSIGESLTKERAASTE